jgi:hypothetical protein
VVKERTINSDPQSLHRRFFRYIGANPQNPQREFADPAIFVDPAGEAG